ncbi:histidine kinase dimerization/phospho-acceptor domain-containing protein [Alkalihalobacillus sp. AL-G]|uniref:histidine kinase dimerization/phospho-acceptor domain-containing protein n=1 Tax=Alkalihalobacillus sp. AL-G TaxID=2926399 RepID=UPI00272C872E|nr:histidine kinase dimerization/phospho-acceptor domain-containing protein [Alkalihalobacillus sp. AL-G]WLD93300.1 ATP-binding protein [Alkalihalobacillus sp. AL-G]
MGIKWNDRIKFTILVLLLTFGITGTLTGLKHGDTYWRTNYFETEKFEYQLDHYLHQLSLELTDKDELKDAIKVTEEEIENYRRTRYGSQAEQISSITDQYEPKIQQAKETGDEQLEEAYKNERDKKIADISKNFESDRYVRQKILNEKEEIIDDYFSEIRDFYSDSQRFQSSFQYYLKNTKTGEIHTDTSVAEMVDVEQRFNEGDMAYFSHFNDLPVVSRQIYFEGSNEIDNLIDESFRSFQGYIGVPKSGNNLILADQRDFQLQRIAYFIYVIGGLGALVLAFFLYKRTDIRQSIKTKSWQPYFDRVPIDVSIFITFFIGFITFILMLNGLGIGYIHRPIFPIVLDVIFWDLIPKALLLLLSFFLGKMLYARVRDHKRLKEEWRKSLILRIFHSLKMVFLNRKTGTQLILLLIVIFCWGAGTILTMIYPALLLVHIPASALIGLPVLILLFRRIGYFNKIAYNVSMLANGNLEKDLPIKGKSVLADHAKNLNTLKHGVKVSQNEQAKSERLKTELITNVSHDLRTPLTSIITYTELLKKTDLSNEERESYIGIIDRKSKRLKVLIDDLFEASKIASGSIDLVKERVDLVQLLQQALAEYNETINESTIQLRVSNPETPVYAVVDGQKLWRVFDNLIGNILKYSLENTRVYISVKTQHDRAMIVFKNVTKYELSEDVDELFDRFKRGDTSRHTEGSGLGLAIAKSIVDLHDGSLDIEVDGDLFKVTVTLKAEAS